MNDIDYNGNPEKTAGAGRKRWKMENEGFNRQKNWQGDITHECSWDQNAMKNYYLMVQTAHQSTETSIAKEVMSAKREKKNLSTKKETAVEIGAVNVDNSLSF